MKLKLSYLASPYSKYPGGKENAFREVCAKAAQLMQEGKYIFCPIAHSHPIEQYGDLSDNSHAFWIKQDFAVLAKCDELLVYKMEGWEESFGVAEEIKMARFMGIPITYMEYTHAVA